MKKSQKTILMILSMMIALLAMSCSELKNDLPATAAPTSIVHSTGWIDTSSEDFHGTYIVAQGYDMRPCRVCHGSTYTGGTSGASCRKCHTNPAGPENCATCHGSSISPAPPTDLAGNTSTTARGVGAHQIHLLGTGTYTSLSIACSDCHLVPGSVYDAGHITTTLRAEVLFKNSLAVLSSGGRTPTPAYNYDSLRCSNTFCHGAWRLTKAGLASDSVYTDTVMVGNSYSPRWNGGTAEKACGTTCHTLPPTGHKSYTTTQSCSSCHEDVTTTAGKPKHMNGKIDLAGNVVRTFR
jgi:hypothetical protein